MAAKVDTVSPEVSAMQQDWALTATLLGGTRAMRSAGKRYLPMWSLEHSEDYDARLALATLFPALEQTIREMTGRAFGEPISLGDDVPAWIASDVWPDIDRQGNNGHVFCREWWRHALAFGLSHVLVEAPLAEGVRTQADQRAAGARPYCIQITPDRVLGWRLGTDGRLSQLRVTWSRVEPGEFGDESVPQIRVYERPGIGPVYVRVFERVRSANGLHEWAEVGQIVTQLADIPLATFYCKRTGYLTADPPFRELAELNRKHWAQQCSTDSLLQTASVPILCAIGIDEETTIAIGAKSAVRISNPNGKLEFVEHSGAAIGAGRESLKDLEDQMRAIGAKLIEPTAGSKTATQASEEAAISNSTLGAWVQDFQDAVAVLFDIIATYRGEESGGTVEMNADLDPDHKPVESMQVLSKMRAQGDLSRATLFAEAQRRGMVSPEIEWEDEQGRIATEAPEPEPVQPMIGNA